MNLLRVSKLPKFLRTTPQDGGQLLEVLRQTPGGNLRVEDSVHIGPNQVHAIIGHPDGSYEDLGLSYNLLCTDGRDLIAAAMGAVGVDGEATGGTATTLVDSGSGWTVDAYKGWTVIVEDAGADVYVGNVGSNTADTLTVDDFLDPDDSAATFTPASGDAYALIPTCRPRYMGITADSGAASAASTTLTSEQTGNGLARALATYAHVDDAATFTLQKQWTASGTVADLHRIGLFTAADTTAAGILVFEAVLNADASVVASDTLTVTDTVTLS